VLFWQTMKKSEFVESNLEIRNFINTDLYKRALDQLASESPSEAFWQNRLKTFAERDVTAKSAQLSAATLATAFTLTSAEANEATQHCH